MALDRLSRRRAATLVLLALATLGCVSLVLTRLAQVDAYNYGWLVWNLFLAWVPFLLALTLYDGYRRGFGRLALGSLGAAWLLFLPNAPYILTDFSHLNEPDPLPLWYDALTITAFAATGLVLGLGSLFLVQAVITAAWGKVTGWTVGLLALALSSVGMYLGHFLDLNSWDALVDPRRVLGSIAARLDDSLVHPRFLAVTIAFTAFLLPAYLLLRAVAQPTLALDPRRDSHR